MSVLEPDDAWVERLRGRDPEALRELLDGIGPGVHAFLARFTGSRDDADDLLQEVVLRVLEGLPRYRHAGRFRAWVFAIAANAARDRVRRRSGEARVLDRQAAPGDAPSADAAAVAREEVTRVEAAIARLPDVQREVFLLRVHTGLTFREIAGLLGCPLNTVLGRMHDAVERLRNAIDSR